MALVFIIFFCILNFVIPKPIIPILGFHGIIDDKTPVPQLVLGKMHYPEQDLEEILEYLIQNNYWFLTTQDLYDFFLKNLK